MSISSAATSSRESARGAGQDQAGRFGFQDKGEFEGAPLMSAGGFRVNPLIPDDLEQTSRRGVYTVIDPRVRPDNMGRPSSVGARQAEAAMLGYAYLAQDGDARRDLQEMADAGDKATVLLQLEDGSVLVIEGSPAAAPDGQLGLKIKGSREVNITLDPRLGTRVLDVTRGFGHGNTMLAAMKRRSTGLPQLAAATVDRIPDTADRDGKVHAAYVLQAPIVEDFQDGQAAIFYASDVTEEGFDPIINGYLVTPSESGITSESGSFRASELAHRAGRVQNFPAGEMTIPQAVATDDLETLEHLRLLGAED